MPTLRPIICPFCFAKFAADTTPFRCTWPACAKEPDTIYAHAQNAPLTPMGRVIQPPQRTLLSRVSVPTLIRCERCKHETRQRLCPECHFELSHDAGLIDEKVIAIIGGRATGKTHYIATLGMQLKQVVGRNFHFALMEMGTHTQNRWENEFRKPLYDDRVLLKATQSAAVDATVKAPLLFRLMMRQGAHTRSLNLSFFDTAGEDMGSLQRMSVQARYITEADGIIFLLDPLQADNVRARLPGANLPTADANARPDRVAVALRGVFEMQTGLKPEAHIKCPVAFTLSKSDTLLTLPEVAPDSKLRKSASHFGVVDWSDMQSESTEVENYVQEWLGSNFLEFVHQGFSDYAFFAVSALGSQPTRDNRLAREVDPIRVEDPFLWLLAKLDLVPTKKGR